MAHVKRTRHKVQEFLSLYWKLSPPWLDFYIGLSFSYLWDGLIFIYIKARGAGLISSFIYCINNEDSVSLLGNPGNIARNINRTDLNEARSLSKWVKGQPGLHTSGCLGCTREGHLISTCKLNRIQARKKPQPLVPKYQCCHGCTKLQTQYSGMCSWMMESSNLLEVTSIS